jgi:hypothetical protein
MSEEGRLTNEEVARIINQEIKSATDLRKELAVGRSGRWDRYHGRALGNEVAGRSQYISRDVMDTIESMLPFFIRTFLAGDPKVDLRVENKPSWIGKVIMDKIQEMLANGEPSLFVTGYQWFKDGLITDTSYVKIFWDYDEVETTLNMPMITPEQMMQLEQDPAIQVTAGEVTLDGYKDVKAKVKRTISDTLKIIGVPHWEFLHHPDSRFMDDEYPKGMQTKVTLDYLKRVNRAYGGDYFEGLDELTVADMERDLDNSIENEGINAKDYVSDVLVDNDTSESLIEGKEPAGTVELVEWYTRIDIDDDGFLEDVVVYRANNKVIRYEELAGDDDIPFAKLSPIMNCYQWQGIAWSELVIEVQNLKTMLMRRILDMFDFQVSGRYIVSPRSGINRTELLNNVPGASISGDTEGIKDITPRPFDVQTIGILEYIDTIKENRTSITKYNQGMDSSSLNKMLDIETMIPMADGSWKVLKDIVDGDIILGGDGLPTTVLRAHEIYTPDSAYRLTFSSGESVIACGDHLWRTKQRTVNEWKVLSTKEIIENGTHYKDACRLRNKWQIPRVKRPMTGKEKELPLDPYILGVWLGDGNRCQAQIGTPDEYVAGRLEQWAAEHGNRLTAHECKNSPGCFQYSIVSNGGEPMTTTLRKMNLICNKHIPEEYFSASYSQRLELLRGLMDTDGTPSRGNGVEWAQNVGRLADDFVRLVESVGGWPSVSVVEHGYEGFSNGGEYVRVHFSLTDNPFSLPRKAAKVPGRKEMIDVQYITSIEPVEPVLMRCLTVDEQNGTFCCGKRFTVSHNTASGIQMIQSAAMQRMELIARIFAETGLKEMYRKSAKLVQKYIREPFMANVHGNKVQITPDMLQGKIVARVNMGVEAAVGIQEGQKILQVFGFLAQANQMYPGIMDPKSVHNLATRYVSSLGFSNVEDYLTDLEGFVKGIQQNMQQQMQMQQMQMQQMQQAEQAKMAIEQAKLAIDQAKVALERDKNKGEQQVDQAKVAIDRGYLQLEEWEKRTDFMLERMKLRQDAAQDRKDFALDMAKLDIDITDKMFARGVQRGNNRAAAGQQRREIMANG